MSQKLHFALFLPGLWNTFFGQHCWTQNCQGQGVEFQCLASPFSFPHNAASAPNHSPLDHAVFYSPPRPLQGLFPPFVFIVPGQLTRFSTFVSNDYLLLFLPIVGSFFSKLLFSLIDSCIFLSLLMKGKLLKLKGEVTHFRVATLYIVFN